jgi:hypothetical protein
MDIEIFIDKIIKICNRHKNSMILYNIIKNLLNKIDTDIFLQKIKDYNFVDIIYKNYLYIKYIVYSSSICDIVLIQWNKNAFTQIHDHPKRGCIVKVLSGKLLEECYKYENDNLDLVKKNYLSINDIGYKISNYILHKIKCIDDAYTIHIYIY